MCRKPFKGTVVDNVLKHGVGGINVDACRVSHNEDLSVNREGCKKLDTNKQGWGFKAVSRGNEGRYPANVILDEEAAKVMDEQSGELTSGSMNGIYNNTIMAQSSGGRNGKPIHLTQNNSKGGASRFFYVAKTSKSERNKGCESLQKKFLATMNDGIGGARQHNINEERAWVRNNHPTVKPLKLMKYLVKMVTPRDGMVLDPFIGSGTTAMACKELLNSCIGIEMNDDYVVIAKARIKATIATRRLCDEVI